MICAGGSNQGVAVHGPEAMQATMFTTDMKVVDMISRKQPSSSARRRRHLLDGGTGKEDGRNIMTAIHTPAEERTWLGMRIWVGVQTAIPMPWCWGTPVDGSTIRWNVRSAARAAIWKGRGWKMKFIIREDGYLKDRTTVAEGQGTWEEIGCTEGGGSMGILKLKLVQERPKYKDNSLKAFRQMGLCLCTKTGCICRKHKVQA